MLLVATELAFSPCLVHVSILTFCWGVAGSCQGVRSCCTCPPLKTPWAHVKQCSYCTYSINHYHFFKGPKLSIFVQFPKSCNCKTTETGALVVWFRACYVFKGTTQWCKPNGAFRPYFVCCTLWFGGRSKAVTAPSSHVKQQKPPAPYVCAHQWVCVPYAWMCWCKAFTPSAQQWGFSLGRSWGGGAQVDTDTYCLYCIHVCARYTCTALYYCRSVQYRVVAQEREYLCRRNLWHSLTVPGAVCSPASFPKLSVSGIYSPVSGFPCHDGIIEMCQEAPQETCLHAHAKQPTGKYCTTTPVVRPQTNTHKWDQVFFVLVVSLKEMNHIINSLNILSQTYH